MHVVLRGFLFVLTLSLTQLLCAQTKKSWNVAIFVYDRAELLDFAGPGEVFAAAGRFSNAGEFKVYTVAAEQAPIISQGFLKVVPEYSVDNCPTPDIVVLPGGATNIPLSNKKVMAWISEIASGLVVGLSVCTGAYLLAKAGLLDGLKATTWYGTIDRFREFAPKTEVLENTRFVDNGKFVTTAGVSAGIDGALHVVSKLLGAETARKTAQYMEYDKWQPFAGLVVKSD
jgi:transcriptional regulator GlxA family with amidase domain